jgi:hypothetical protein
VEKLNRHWTPLAAVTLRLGPLAKAAGWAGGLVVAGVQAVDSLGRDSPLARLAGGLRGKERPQLVDIGTLHVLKDLVEHLDSQRREKDAAAPPFGGLRPHMVEDGRLLWLCPDHLSAYN